MVLRSVAMILAVFAARVAAAESWSFDWHCQSTSTGDCGPTGASGTEGPFASSGACEVAQANVLLRLNGPGNAGTTSGCRDAESGATSSGPSGSSGTPARLDRWFLGMTGGRGYAASYAGGTDAQAAKQLGGQLELVLGRPTIGLSIFAGLERDDGTAPPTVMTSSMWMLDFGVGIVISPVALRTKAVELRPELGLYGIELERLGCDRCDVDGPLGTQMPAEPSSAFGGRIRAGVSAYFDRTHEHGLALDALIQLVHLGDGSDPLASAVLTPPRVMFRLSYVSRRLD